MSTDDHTTATSDAANASSIGSATCGSAPCINTFDTEELLENILLFLPLRELLAAQRVCKTWSMSINASIKAQRALYMEPQSDATCAYLMYDHFEDHPPWPYIPQGTWANALDGEMMQPTLNPLLTRNFFCRPASGSGPARFISLLHDGIISPNWQISKEQDPKFMGPVSKSQLSAIHRPEASWRNMFVTQPPCEQLSFICMIKNGVVQDTTVRVMVERFEGVTMGDVVDRLREHWFECPLHSTARQYDGKGRWDFEGLLFTQLKVFNESDVDQSSARDFVQHLESIAYV